MPRCGITPSRERRETRRPSDALEGWTGLEPVTTALQAVALPLSYHPMCPASTGRGKRKERDHFPERADRVVGQAGIEPTISNVNTQMGDHTPLSHIISGLPEGGAGLPRYAPASGIFRSQEPQGGFEPHYVMRQPNQDVPRPRHRAAAYLRVPSVRLSSVTDFRFATAFSPCGGSVLRSRLRQFLSLQEGLFFVRV